MLKTKHLIQCCRNKSPLTVKGKVLKVEAEVDCTTPCHTVDESKKKEFRAKVVFAVRRQFILVSIIWSIARTGKRFKKSLRGPMAILRSILFSWFNTLKCSDQVSSAHVISLSLICIKTKNGH